MRVVPLGAHRAIHNALAVPLAPPSYQEILPYLEKALVSERPHPKNPAVRIFNYTQVCQFSGAWDDVTRQCRGLVLNVETGDVLANPFPKFFNYQEHLHKGWPIPDEPPIISEKLDGSLGILVHVNGKAFIATRGSFESDQAKWATDWWWDNVPVLADRSNTFTDLFEIIYPQNRIVVEYDFSGLVYLGSRVTATGEHIDRFSLFDGCGIRRAKVIPSCALEMLAAMDEPNSEGFVCHYPQSNVRLKIKFPEYVRLHKVVTGLSEIGIWEGLRDGTPMSETLERVPDEFFGWVESIQTKLNSSYERILAEAQAEFRSITEAAPSDRKAFALAAQKSEHAPLLFRMYDSKPVAPLIWKSLRPAGRSSFITDIDS